VFYVTGGGSSGFQYGFTLMRAQKTIQKWCVDVSDLSLIFEFFHTRLVQEVDLKENLEGSRFVVRI